jgi:cytoskeleton protein RodZ
VTETTQSHGDPVESAGTLLKAERCRQDLSLGDVSRYLKLAVRQVDALERDDYEVFGGPVFVRGFIRNYAKLLRLDPSSVVELANRKLTAGGVTSVEAAAEASPVSEAPVEHVANQSLLPLFLAAAILAGLIAGWVLIRDDDPQPHSESAPPAPMRETLQQAAQTEPADATGGVAQPAAVTEPAEPTGQVPVRTPITEPGAELAAVTEDDAPRRVVSSAERAAAPQGELYLEFVAESWVEVTDGFGEVIFAELGAGGQWRSISGAAPLSLVVGNAAGVKVTYNGELVELVARTGSGVVRLELE